MARLMALVAAGVFVALAWLRATSFEGPELVYALDDPYIHLSLVRHLVESGTWGLSTGMPTSASSSYLWTSALAATWAALPWDGWPLAWVSLLSVPVALEVEAALRRSVPVGWQRGLGVGAILTVGGQLALLMSGLEHMAHIWLVLAWTRLVVAWVEDGDRGMGWLALTAALAGAMMGVRLESAFVLVASGLVLLRWQRLGALMAAVAGSTMALLATVAANMMLGAGPMANSVVAKSGMLHADGVVGGLWAAAVRVPLHLMEQHPNHLGTMAALLAAVALLVRWSPADSPGERGAWTRSLIFLGTAVLHLCFARLGWLFRYEAYLVVLGSISAVSWWSLRGRPEKPVVLTVVGLAALLLGVRGFAAAHDAWRGPEDIYGQHLQMSRVLAQRFDGASVAANDVGAISYYANLQITDLVGLGDTEVLTLRRQGRFSAEVIDQIAVNRGVQYAVVYEDWFQGAERLPSQWVPVEDWTLPSTTVAGSPRVTWLAVEGDPEVLRQKLAGWRLPAGVRRVVR